MSIPTPSGVGAVPPRVGFFVTCLTDLFRPNVGFAAVRLLEQAGCEVVVPEAQTCCGQPALNSGDNDSARALARQVIEAFAGFDYVVGPLFAPGRPRPLTKVSRRGTPQARTDMSALPI